MAAPSNLASHFGGIGRALSSRNYRIYWFGQIGNVFGAWVTRFGAGILIWDLTQSPAWLGIIGFLQFFPIMLLGPVAGAISDIVGHRRTAILATITQIVLLAILSSLTLAGVMTPIVLAIFVGAIGVVHSFEFPPRQALIPRLVPRENLSAAIAMNSTTFNVAAVLGPVIGGALIKFGNPSLGNDAAALNFLFHTGTTVILCGALSAIRVPDLPRNARKLTDVFGEMRLGFTYTAQHVDIRLLLLLSVIASLLIRPYLDLLPGFAIQIFAGGDRILGGDFLSYLLAASGGGALLTSLMITVRGRTEGLTRMLIFAMVVSAAGLLLFTPTANLWVGLLAMALTGGLATIGAISAQSLIQNIVDDAFRARVISVQIALVQGAAAIGALTLGAIAELIGLRPAEASAAVLTLLIVGLTAGPLLRRTATIEAEP